MFNSRLFPLLLLNSIYSLVLSQKGHSKLLVLHGQNNETLLREIEVIDLSSPQTECHALKNIPFVNSEAPGVLGHMDLPVTCGGYNRPTSCYSYINDAWRVTSYLNTGRSAPAMTRSPFPSDDSTLFITGGWDSGKILDSAEILGLEGWEYTTPMPATVWRHCMVLVNSTSAMVIGGHHDNGSEVYPDTYIFNSQTKDWSYGPPLKYKRAVTTCGMINKDSEGRARSVIVAGGWENWNYLPSVEILDLGTNKWRRGPALPFGFCDATMVEDPSGGVIIVGGSDGNGSMDTLMRLIHAGGDAKWEILPQKLKTPRRYLTAILIPDELTDCTLDGIESKTGVSRI